MIIQDFHLIGGHVTFSNRTMFLLLLKGYLYPSPRLFLYSRYKFLRDLRFAVLTADLAGVPHRQFILFVMLILSFM